MRRSFFCKMFGWGKITSPAAFVVSCKGSKEVSSRQGLLRPCYPKTRAWVTMSISGKRYSRRLTMMAASSAANNNKRMPRLALG